MNLYWLGVNGLFPVMAGGVMGEFVLSKAMETGRTNLLLISLSKPSHSSNLKVLKIQTSTQESEGSIFYTTYIPYNVGLQN